MKEVYNKELGITELHPETPLEAFMDLKEFIIASWPVTRNKMQRQIPPEFKRVQKNLNKLRKLTGTTIAPKRRKW
jgi:hypothetical protein